MEKVNKKSASSLFIDDEYKLQKGAYLFLRFDNQGSGEVRVEYSSKGYVAHHD